MKATIEIYKTNAYVGADEVDVFNIVWDGYTWDNEEEWNQWADEELSPIKGAENYEDVKMTLYIYTNHRIR